MARDSASRRLNHSRAASTRSSENDSESNVAEIGKILKRELCVALQPRPFEVRTRIGFATRRDVRMTGERFDRIPLGERLEAIIQRRILGVLEPTSIVAFQFDAPREVVASLAPEEARKTRVPRAFVARHILLDHAVTSDHEMRRHAHAAQSVVIRMSVVIETILEEFSDCAAAEFIGRQADVVNDNERWLDTPRTRFEVRRRYTMRSRVPAVGIDRTSNVHRASRPVGRGAWRRAGSAEQKRCPAATMASLLGV